MKKMTVLIAALFALAAPLASFAAMDHSDHGSMDMGHGDHSMMAMGDVAHQEVVDGVKATFKVMSMKDQMKGMEMPKGMKETHHIMVEFQDVKTGKALTEGDVKVKVQGPDKTELTKDLMGMQGHFGADFDLSQKGKYGVMCKFQLKDGKVHNAKFWYTVK
jgi:opacity protein-like surface antigen